MRAVLLKARGELAVEEISTPRPREDEVLLRMEARGVCGSDVRYFHGDNPFSDAMEAFQVAEAKEKNNAVREEKAGKPEG